MLRTLFFPVLVALFYVVLPSLAKRPDVYAIAIEECKGGKSKCAQVQVIGEMEFFNDEEEVDNSPHFPDEDEDEDDEEKDKDEDDEENDEDEYDEYEYEDAGDVVKDEDEDDEDEDDEEEVYVPATDDYYDDKLIPALKTYTRFGVGGRKNSKAMYTSAGHRNIKQNPIGKLMDDLSRGISDRSGANTQLAMKKNEEQPKRFTKRSLKTMKLSKVNEDKVPFILRRILGVDSKAKEQKMPSLPFTVSPLKFNIPTQIEKSSTA